MEVVASLGPSGDSRGSQNGQIPEKRKAPAGCRFALSAQKGGALPGAVLPRAGNSRYPADDQLDSPARQWGRDSPWGLRPVAEIFWTPLLRSVRGPYLVLRPRGIAPTLNQEPRCGLDRRVIRRWIARHNDVWQGIRVGH